MPQITCFFAPLYVLLSPKWSFKIDLKYRKTDHEQIFKKTAPQYNSNTLNCKRNREKANNCPGYRFAVIKYNGITSEKLLSDTQRELESMAAGFSQNAGGVTEFNQGLQMTSLEVRS